MLLFIRIDLKPVKSLDSMCVHVVPLQNLNDWMNSIHQRLPYNVLDLELNLTFPEIQFLNVKW